MKIWKAAGVLAAGMIGVRAVGAVLGPDPVVVEKIVDGDTIDVSLDGETTRVRFLNVDTPEIGRDGAPSECLAEEARTYLESLLPVGTEVTLEFDAERLDPYGRTLAGVYRGDELVNALIAREGLGVAVDIAPNHRFFPEVAAAQREAESVARGISTLGPECFVAASDARTLDDAQQAAQAADNADSVLDGPELNGAAPDARAERARGILSEVTAARAGLRALGTARERQSAFQRSAYGDDYRERVDELDARLAAAEKTLREVVERENQRSEDARKAAEREARAREQAAAVQQQATPQDQQPTPQDPKPAPAPQATQPGAGADAYTGCRAYGGNYAMTSVDAKGRPYAKIDCTTKAQIG